MYDLKTQRKQMKEKILKKFKHIQDEKKEEKRIIHANILFKYSIQYIEILRTIGLTEKNTILMHTIAKKAREFLDDERLSHYSKFYDTCREVLENIGLFQGES